MPYSIALANRVREYLAEIPYIIVEEKAMFGGLAFLVNDKMCINIGEDSLMCRFAPKQTEEIAENMFDFLTELAENNNKEWFYR